MTEIVHTIQNNIPAQSDCMAKVVTTLVQNHVKKYTAYTGLCTNDNLDDAGAWVACFGKKLKLDEAKSLWPALNSHNYVGA